VNNPLKVTFSHLTAMILPKERGTFLTWAMKSAATASYSAVPSMLMVAPMGITKRATLGSIPFFSSSAATAIGRVAELHIRISSRTLI